MVVRRATSRRRRWIKTPRLGGPGKSRALSALRACLFVPFHRREGSEARRGVGTVRQHLDRVPLPDSPGRDRSPGLARSARRGRASASGRCRSMSMGGSARRRHSRWLLHRARKCSVARPAGPMKGECGWTDTPSGSIGGRPALLGDAADHADVGLQHAHRRRLAIHRQLLGRAEIGAEADGHLQRGRSEPGFGRQAGSQKLQVQALASVQARPDIGRRMDMGCNRRRTASMARSPCCARSMTSRSNSCTFTAAIAARQGAARGGP